ncbi:MAG: glucose-6-phosphate isomerase, partial [Myxococcota bacterium]
IAARGATDQHSQLQLYAEGPADKVVLFLSARERGVDLPLPESVPAGQPEYGYLAGHTMSELIDAEMRGTLASLVGRGRPCGTMVMERINAHGVGELLMLLEAATALAGPLYGVNPYDQPGVEEAKRLAYGALGRPGFEEFASRLDSVSLGDTRYVF